ncbi:MAG TPA: hypothetical protein VIM61_10995 [Chthoniobacterales bacterium]
MKFRGALRRAAEAARENFLPGLVLWALMLVFLALYFWNDGTREFLGHVAEFKQRSGYVFAFVSYVIVAALLPELMRIVFFQRGRPMARNLANFLTAAPMWGLLGMSVDLLYRLQVVWFGAGSDLGTILCKMAVDQFLYSPFFSAPVIVGWLFWRDAGFRGDAFRRMFTGDFVFDRIFPIVVAGWCVWIPGVSLVYFMPSALQLPTAVTIQIFWVLIITTLAERKGAPPPADLPPAFT